MTTTQGLGIDGHWIGTHDADPRAVALYRRHYSAQARLHKNHKSGFIGPSERMVLITVDCSALFAWRLMLPPDERISKLARPDRRREKRGNEPTQYFGDQTGLMCTIFRNEGYILSSELILEAECLAWQRWPGIRLFTYVWDSKIASVNPGYCFKKAGWKSCGRNADGRMSILEKLPEGN